MTSVCLNELSPSSDHVYILKTTTYHNPSISYGDVRTMNVMSDRLIAACCALVLRYLYPDHSTWSALHPRIIFESASAKEQWLYFSSGQIDPEKAIADITQYHCPVGTPREDLLLDLYHSVNKIFSKTLPSMINILSGDCILFIQTLHSSGRSILSLKKYQSDICYRTH